MKYAIQIHEAPSQSAAARTGYQFTRALLDAGHELIRVFFHGDGVYGAFAPAGSGTAWRVPDWAGLAGERAIDLVFCSTAAERRGLLRSDAGGWQGLPPLPGFRPGGLGLWMEACLTADRVVTFGR